MLKKSQVKFISYFAVVFIAGFIILYSVGLVPESLKVNDGDSLRVLWDKAQEDAINNQVNQEVVVAESPTRIVIDKIGVDTTVANPNTTNISTLDEYLRQGAVHYPGSGLLGTGNMFIFGHSSELKVVNNPAYKVFTHIRDLKAGDIINVYAGIKKYVYRVTSVRMVDKYQALVTFNQSKNMLTLSTCNTLGAPSERYVVEADFVP